MESLRSLLFITFLLVGCYISAQSTVVGYIYESGNRGYISEAEVQIKRGNDIIATAISDESGQYEISNIPDGNYAVLIEKLPFIKHAEDFSVGGEEGDKVFLKHEISKLPGYVFEITLAEKDGSPDGYRSGVKGSLVEVYNNTARREELVITDLQDPEFKVDFVKGNHYTILVRKEGFLSKRMEAYVDVASCILCFEGVGEVTPGVSDNLTNDNSNGVLLANVELERFEPSKIIGLQDIYYATNKASLTRKSRTSLDAVAVFVKDNPQLVLELGAHTDTNGKSAYNQELSQKRASNVVDYLVEKHGIQQSQLIAHGYGEAQPVNDCGSRCSETEHAENRRTELKILEVRNNVQHRSLRQMKVDENMADILAELESEGQIKVPVEADPEEVVKASKADRLSPIKEAQPDDVKVHETATTFVNETPQETQSAEIEVASPETESTRVVEAQPSAQITYVDESIQEENWIAHQAVPVEESLPPSIDKAATLNGYKIVILFSRYELAQDHPLLQRFPDLNIYTTADGNKLYLIESFDTRKEAEKRINQRYSTSYPSAYAVGFQDGVIVD